MKIPIQSGNVSKRKTIEASTKSARTGNLASSVRTIPIASVQLFVPENPRLIDVKTESLNACESKPLESVGTLSFAYGFQSR